MLLMGSRSLMVLFGCVFYTEVALQEERGDEPKPHKADDQQPIGIIVTIDVEQLAYDPSEAESEQSAAPCQ